MNAAASLPRLASDTHPSNGTRKNGARDERAFRSKRARTLVQRLARRRGQSASASRLIERFLTDATTRLPNHYAFELAYTEWRRQARQMALLLVDIVGFSGYNERRGGHARGNELLASFATSLRASVGADDFVGRWAVGDEFLVAADDIDNAADLERLRARLEGPFRVRWGRRHRLLRCYAVGIIGGGRRLPDIERILHERLRRVKLVAKAESK